VRHHILNTLSCGCGSETKYDWQTNEENVTKGLGKEWASKERGSDRLSKTL